jgi:hypothetical protein
MKTTNLAIAAICTLFVSYVPAAEAPKTFTGVITDTMCGSKPHSNMMKDKTEAECVQQCARGPYGYALADGTTVMKLSDRKAPAKYAGQKVKVTGVYDEKSKTLKVVSIESADGN